MQLIIKYLPILITCWWCSNLGATEQRQIELNDGSVIVGEIIAFNQGTYTIKSTTLGTLMLKDSNIRTIRSPTTNSAAPSSLSSNPAISSELQNLQNLIMNDPEMMNSIASLQNDPQFQAILQDTEIMNAITSGNFNELLNHPNFAKFLENKKVKEITKQIIEQK